MKPELRIKNRSKGPALREQSESKGFIALMTALVISVVLLVVTISLNQSGFLTRLIITESEAKEQSAGFAEACADYAILRLANNPAYPGNETDIPVGFGSCSVRPVLFDTPNTGEITIETKSVHREATTNLRVVVAETDLVIKSWVEVASFAP